MKYTQDIILWKYVVFNQTHWVAIDPGGLVNDWKGSLNTENHDIFSTNIVDIMT